MLKLFAALFMLLDHIGFYFYDALPELVVLFLRLIGRLAFPVFAWSIARGYQRTHNLPVYFLRLLGFALGSEVIIRLGFSLINLEMAWTNVLVTFSLAVVALTGYRLARDASLDVVASLRPIPAAPCTVPVPPHFNVRVSLGGITLDARLGIGLGSLSILLALLAAEWLHADYGAYGILTVLGFYIAMDKTPEEHWEQRFFALLVPVNGIFLAFRVLSQQSSLNWAMLQLFSLLAIPLIIMWRRDKKPPSWLKYAFYVFYPLHILLLCVVRLLLVGPFS